jgi:hypothetical protein
MAFVSQEQLALELGTLEANMRAEMAELRGDLRAEMAELRGELRAEMAGLRGDITATLHRELRSQTWRLGGAVFVAFGLFATLVRAV